METVKTTAAQAVKAECRLCNNTKYYHGCASEICELNNKSAYKSTHRMIKAHCLTCTPDGSLPSVKNCDGKIYKNGSIAKCNLHPFRLGKNPFRRKREYSEEQRAELRQKFVANRASDSILKKNPPLSAERHGWVWVWVLRGLKIQERRLL